MKQGGLTHSLTPNLSVSRDKSIEYTHGNNTASYSYTTTGTGENEKINGTQGTVPCAVPCACIVGFASVI